MIPPATDVLEEAGRPRGLGVRAAGVWRRVAAVAVTPAFVDAVLPTIALRVVFLLFGAVVAVLLGNDAVHGSLLEIWNRWDAPHFAEVAQWGYGPPADRARIAIFPAFPALIATVSMVTDRVTAGMIISFAATVAAAAGLFRLVTLDSDRAVARRAVVAMSVFPTAFSLVAPYSEAPFLAFVIWSFVFAREGNWRAAGLLALFAGATRIYGAFLFPALAVEYWLPRRRLGRDAVWLLLALGGPLIYLGINFVTFGDPLYFLSVQRDVFALSTVAPWVAVPNLISNVLNGPPTATWATVYVAPLLALIVVIAVTAWTAASRWSRPSYLVYTGLVLLNVATLSWPISSPRYIVAVFPMFIAAGHVASRPSIATPLLVGSTLLLGACVTLFVTGRWAF